ncbi:DUF1214 domain-containing protein [Zavarzinia compransoris]|uniref:DUF1214 domain-containing protein n=1 Tax=Zavarzinia marina TaxID=2911065 RepID=UPI001F430A09|nr:DUF1214 domain-containing protein [Zavarzinia marina]MCF4165253.1 DUF1214 domain-containing protein [Zavarzinia marina]
MTEGVEDRILSGEAWQDFCRTIANAGNVILRETAPGTVLDRAEGIRYISRLTRAFLESAVEYADPDFPALRRLAHETVKIGADNPDNVYLAATVAGDRDYRITGRRGTISYFSIGSKANRYAIDGTMASTGELNDKDLAIGPDGRFEIVASATPKPGNWLPLAEDSTLLVVRQSYLDRETEVPGEYSIACIGGPETPPPLPAAHLNDALQKAGMGVMGTAFIFAQWTELFMSRPNELPDWGQAMFQKAGGDPDIFYLHGYWHIGPDEAWVIETEVPDCPYWNFQLNNWWMESLDYRHHRIWVNKHTADLNSDGTLTLVIAPRDPGFGCWIDTAGHDRGTALLRWLGAKDHPLPRCRVVKI